MFHNFLEDMGLKPEGYTLERINNDEGYCPANCKWATPAEQARNRRTNVLITYKGETLTVMDWSIRVGINFNSMVKRFKKWPLEKAIETPKLK